MTDSKEVKYNISELWDLVYEYGKYVRDNKLDGLKKWNEIKNLLLKIKIPKLTSIDWSDRSKKLFCELTDEYKVTGFKDGFPKDQEAHHFLVQHGRIVKLYNFDVRRLLQIAYNKGQFISQQEREKDFIKSEKSYTDDQIKFYNDNNLGNIETYVSENNIKTINNNFNKIIEEIVEKIEKEIEPQEIEKKGGNIPYNELYMKYINNKNIYFHIK